MPTDPTDFSDPSDPSDPSDVSDLSDVSDPSEPGTTLSVVVPMYNEEDALPALVGRLRPALDAMALRYEVVAVDDGSKDRTAELLAEFRNKWPELRIVRLRGNSGHQAALTAGLHSATGEYVASIDADLQDPPEKIPEMLDLARADGLDIVYGVRADRSTDTGFKRHSAGAYYWLVRRLVGKQVPAQAGDFRLLSRAAVEAVKSMPDQHQVYRLLVPWLGFPSGQVTYQREERVAGETKYPLSKMLRLGVDSVINFSAAPLRLATWLGVASFFGCLLMVGATLAIYLTGKTVPGWTSLFIVMLFLGGVQLICVGLLGEYIGRIYTAVQRRPTYFVGYDSAAEPTMERAAEPARETRRGAGRQAD